MVFKPSVIQPLYVQCFHFVKTKAYKVMLQYSSYYIGFFDYDMSYIVALFICLLFPSFQHWTYFTHRALCSPSSNPFILVKVREKGFNLRIVYDDSWSRSKNRSYLNYLYLYIGVKIFRVKSDITDCSQNRCKLWCQTKNPLHYLFFICIWFMKFYIRLCYN